MKPLTFVATALCTASLLAVSNSEFAMTATTANEANTQLLAAFVSPSRIHCTNRCARDSNNCNAIEVTESTDGNLKICKLFKVDFGDTDIGRPMAGYHATHPVMRLSTEGFKNFYGFAVREEGSRFKVVIHHDTEQRTLVNGYEDCRSYVKTVTYAGEIAKIRYVVRHASYCQQSFKLEGKKVFIHQYSCAAWKSLNGETRSYFPSRRGNEECYCSGVEACCCGKTRNCKIDDNNFNNVWVTDEGYFTSKNHLPVVEMSFGDTGDSDEISYHTLGPLDCFI